MPRALHVRRQANVILEGIVTTINADGSANIAPMGPRVDLALERLVLRPFRTSRTYENLKRTGQGVLHVTDDVELIARAAVGEVHPAPRMERAQGIEGWILVDACRWYTFRVDSLDDREDRTHIEARVVSRGTVREFFGFNRAKHAVLEAAIVATRTALLPPEQVAAEFERLATIVDKTGGPQERRALEFLRSFVRQATATRETIDW
jgi:hypothetical protein